MSEQPFVERRRSMVEIGKSTEREMGELVATVKALAENTNRQFAELGKEVEKLSNQFNEYKNDQVKQALKDYEYLDNKIGGVEVRVKSIEAAHDSENRSPVRQFFQKMLDTGASLITGGIAVLIVWAVIEYLKSTGKV